MDKNTVRPLKELLDSVRGIEGFPIAKDEDILTLSDPPFYTVCPNPYIVDFIKEYGKPFEPETDNYHKEPFVGDVSEGKNDPIYNAHSYHTKVPHKAIMKYIQHYTEPGDIIFDGFCGTGMTGVAARMLDRRAVLSDLSPIASYIAYSYNRPFNQRKLLEQGNLILSEIEDECRWLFETRHTHQNSDQKTLNDRVNKIITGKITYIVWSDVFTCPFCLFEYTFFNVALDLQSGIVSGNYKCPNCNAIINKRDSGRAKIKILDQKTGNFNELPKQKPVLIKYSVGKKSFEKEPDQDDLELLEKIEQMEIPYWFPENIVPKGDKTVEALRLGITRVHQFYTKRNLWVLSKAWDAIQKSGNPILKIWFTSSLIRTTKMYKFTCDRKMGTVNGTYYLPSLFTENPAMKLLKYKLKDFSIFDVAKDNAVFVQCGDSGHLSTIPSNSMDYIFTDPPFGSNLMYSELNLIWESWLRVFTNNTCEAIINQSQNKVLMDYTVLMTNCFKEFFRVLKPNRWMTVEFHNSKANIWNAIQESISRAGFIVAQVAILDKKQGTYNQVNASGAVKNDLVISAYKPKKEFTERFLRNAGEGMEVDFIMTYLEHLPVKPNIGRNEKMMYSKMLAHYIENGFKIKYDSKGFYTLLSDNFIELDGYWFNEEQVKQYNQWKSGLSLDELRTKLSGQQVLFISDEKSALTWLFYFLANPKTFSDIYTAYQQVTTTTEDEIPELKELLENNFILEEGKYRRPLSEAERNEIEQNREKEMDRAFKKLLEHCRTQKGKVKQIRKEVLIHGFTKSYQEERYHDILAIADKLYASTIESSGEIMDFIDIARIKTAGEEKQTKL